MAKVNIKFDTKSATKRVESLFKKVKLNKKMNEEIGTVVVDKIAFQARRGKPMNNTGRFPNLREASVAIRDRLSKLNKTHPAFDPKRSNITLTGQLIDGLKFKFNRSLGVIEIFTSGSRKKIKGSDDKATSNEIVDKEIRKRGFVMFTPKAVDQDTKLKKRINNIVRRTLRRALAVSNKLDKL